MYRLYGGAKDYGCRNKAADFYFEDEWAGMVRKGPRYAHHHTPSHATLTQHLQIRKRKMAPRRRKGPHGQGVVHPRTRQPGRHDVMAGHLSGFGCFRTVAETV